MHQPYYKDPLTGAYSVPWVRLHGIRAYYDMAKILLDFPDIRVTVNFVPSLLLQILDYQQGQARDIFQEYTLKPAVDLEAAEQRFILRYFFMANWETMVKPMARYYELLHDRGVNPDEQTLDRAVFQFKARDYLDLQVLFNLSWFGFKAVEESPALSELISKGRNYTEEDKAVVIRHQHKILRGMIALYKGLEETGQIELTTSPFYHPILPLIYDTNIARRCMPNSPLPDRFEAPEDAKKQILKAVQFHSRIFGKMPRGCWPSEGSVCPEVIPFLADAGLRWIATDEEILLNSMPLLSRKDALYRSYIAESEGRDIGIVFRDKEISNLLSFTFGRMDAASAVDSLFKRFKAIHDMFEGRNESALVTIILDGENPWEYYPEGGRRFLSELYSRLSKSSDFMTVRISDDLDRHPPRQRVHHLYSGSWINHDFDIWIGTFEENLAWEYLSRTRRALLPLLNDASMPAERREAAWEAIYAAEGSDWFWWYGDDFTSAQEEEFDRLFREHLAGAFRHLGLEVPKYLSRPIIHLHPAKHVIVPVNFIHPVLDGKRTSYFEWQGAGRYDAMLRTIMFGAGPPLLSAIYFGFNLTHCYFRIDPVEGDGPEKLKGYEFHVHFFDGPQEYKCVIPGTNGVPSRFFINRSSDGIQYELLAEADTIAMGQILEIGVPFDALGWKQGERFSFCVEVLVDGKVIETYPPKGYIPIEMPGRDFEQMMWSV